MSSILGARPSSYDRQQRILHEAKERPYFPDGKHDWKEFISPYQKIGLKMPFAITLQEMPRSGDVTFVFSGDIREETLFGVLTARSDNKLGELCFGRMSKTFGGTSDHPSRSSIFALDDGFDSKFLHVFTTEDGWFLPLDTHKVTCMDVKFESVMSKLHTWMWPMVGDEKQVPNDVEAASLDKLRKYVKRFLAECGGGSKDDVVRLLLGKIDARVDLRKNQIRGEKAVIAERLTYLDMELRKLED